MRENDRSRKARRKSPRAALLTATPIARSIFAGTGEINRKSTVVKCRAIQQTNSFLGLGLRAHFHKSESFGPARVAVFNHVDRLHLARLREKPPQIILGRRVGKITDVQFCFHSRISPRKGLPPSRGPVGRSMPLPLSITNT